MGYRTAVLVKGRSPILHDTSFVLASIDDHIFLGRWSSLGTDGTNLKFTEEY